MWVANLPFISYSDSPADDLAPEESTVPDEGDDKLHAIEFTAGDLDAKCETQKHESCIFRIKSKLNYENGGETFILHSLTSETVIMFYANVVKLDRCQHGHGVHALMLKNHQQNQKQEKVRPGRY